MLRFQLLRQSGTFGKVHPECKQISRHLRRSAEHRGQGCEQVAQRYQVTVSTLCRVCCNPSHLDSESPTPPYPLSWSLVTQNSYSCRSSRLACISGTPIFLHPSIHPFIKRQLHQHHPAKRDLDHDPTLEQKPMSSSGGPVPHHPQLIPMHEWQGEGLQHSSATKDSQRQSIRTPGRSLAQAPEDPEIQISRREGVGVGRGCSSKQFPSMLLARFWMCRPTPSPLALHQPPRSSALVLVRVLVNEDGKARFCCEPRTSKPGQMPSSRVRILLSPPSPP
jgi:hypothetical protein